MKIKPSIILYLERGRRIIKISLKKRSWKFKQEKEEEEMNQHAFRSNIIYILIMCLFALDIDVRD